MIERKDLTLYEDVDKIRVIRVVNTRKYKMDYFFRRRGAEWEENENDLPVCSSCGYMPLYDPAQDDFYYSAFCPDCGEEMKNGKPAYNNKGGA